ncbi:MAG: CCA tRNA nucleotidyltransferase [Alphaproteobacteria bacterium]
MREPATLRLLDALRAAGIEARFVGGCVRDALLGSSSADLDLATPARPEEVIAALEKAGIRAVPTGIAHGTVTAVVPPLYFEITTLRRDVETYGRRARVAFDADWAEDAARRDFTINALYLDPDGTVYDPVGGLADLAARRVRFVGEPARRIAEDVLRVLRYYRFEARFGRGEGDRAAREACREAVPLLPTLSAERVAQEVLRLLVVADPVPVLRMMRADGVLAAILPEATRLDRLERLIAVEQAPVAGNAPTLPSPAGGGGLKEQFSSIVSPLGGEGLSEPATSAVPSSAGGGGSGWGQSGFEADADAVPDPVLRLAALVDVDAEGAMRLAERLRLSNAMRDRLAGLATPWPLDPAAGDREQRRALYRLGADRVCDLARLLAAEGRLDRERLADLLARAAAWEAPVFPIAGRDVAALGIPPGPRIGRLLGEVRDWWEESDFRADRAACLARLNELIAQQRRPAGNDGAIDGRNTAS